MSSAVSLILGRRYLVNRFKAWSVPFSIRPAVWVRSFFQA
jgi:hypothetical protein